MTRCYECDAEVPAEYLHNSRCAKCHARRHLMTEEMLEKYGYENARIRQVMFDAWQDTDWLLIANEVYDMGERV